MPWVQDFHHVIAKGKPLMYFMVSPAKSTRRYNMECVQQWLDKTGYCKTLNIGTDRLQILIRDRHDSHNFVELIETGRDNNIEIIELPAHTSHWLQL